MNESQKLLSHQKLDVYQKSIQHLDLALRIIERVPRGNAALCDQLRRAAFSVTLNIAEGAGRVSGPDKKRHFAIARGSALECSAICDCLKTAKLIEERQQMEFHRLLHPIVSMLSKLSRS